MSMYDVNFCFPVRDLENDRVKLTAFIPTTHSQSFWDGVKDTPATWRYLPFPAPTSSDSLEAFYESFRQKPQWILYAVIDKASNKLAGMMGYILTDPANLKTEIGAVIILPEFQRTHVNSNAVGLLLHYALEPTTPHQFTTTEYTNTGNTGPTTTGLGLRRFQWQAHQDNQPSIRAAQRLGFLLEGVLRWDRVLPAGNVGIKPPSGEERGGRHSAMLSMCWDDWLQDGKKEHVLGLMRR